MAMENVYASLLDYINDYHRIPFSYPDHVADESEKARMQDIVDHGHAADKDLNRLAGSLISKAGFDYGRWTLWKEKYERMTTGYLAIQMADESFCRIPVCISLYVEKCGEDKTRFRVALGLTDENARKDIVDRFHKYLTLPVNIDSGLKLACGSDEWGNPRTLTMSWGEAKAKADRGEFKNVQLCKYIDRIENETEEYYEKEILSAINLLKPYYEKAIGIR